MRSRGRYQIEPLSEEAWLRVEHRVFAALDELPTRSRSTRSARRVRPSMPLSLQWAAAAATAAVTLVIAESLRERVASPARSTSAGGPQLVTLEGSPHAPGQRWVSSGTDGRRFWLGGTRVQMASRSQLAYEPSPPTRREPAVAASHATKGPLREAAGYSVLLVEGEVEFDVPKGLHLSASAGNLRIRASDAAFRLTLRGDAARGVVQRGSARAMFPGGTRLLRAGQHWPALETDAPQSTHPPKPKPVVTSQRPGSESSETIATPD